MANCLCFAPATSFMPTNKPALICGNCNVKRAKWMNDVTKSTENVNFVALVVKATTGDQSSKSNSILCGDCDGNGAVQCSQCKGNGVNSVDLFNGQFKAGDECWLCSGKKHMLCGNCNGAGFVGGFLSTRDE